MIWGSGGSKSRLAKAAGAEPAGQMKDEKLHAVVVQKIHQRRTTFGSYDVEKVHAVMARNTFRNQNIQNTPASDHFWKLRCRKSARRCGAKYISKSKYTKHTIPGPLLEVEMSKKCTPLWREAHFEIKMYKTLHVRVTFGGSNVEKVHAVVTRSTFRSENIQNTGGFGPLLEVQMSLRRFASLHYTTLHYTTLHYTTLHYTTLRSTTLHYIKLHYTPLHYITLHYAPQHYNYNYNYTTTLHYTKLHYTTLHYATLHSTTLHSTTLHYTTLPSTTLHYITLHCTPLHYNYNYDYTTTLPYTKLHYTTLHSTTLHYTTLHYTTLQYTE